MRRANIVLVGFMGTGKSAVGRLLAAKLGRPFLDMDAVIEERQGMPIPRIFAEQGEARFRQLEHELAVELSKREALVIAAGGGIVLDRRNIEALSSSGLVACLTAGPEEILRRVAGDTNRPLLAVPDKLGRIRGLLEARRAHYAAVPCQVDTEGKTPEQVAQAVLGAFHAIEP